MLKRILIAFENLGESESLIRYSQIFQEKFDVEVVGIYIKDIRKYEVVPPMAEGIIIDSSNGFAMKEWEAVEEKKAEEIKTKYRESYPSGKFIIEDGIGLEKISEKMRAFDMLIISKGEYINSNLKTILKFHTKPIILVPNKIFNKFEKPLFLDDNGIRANSSLMTFVNNFNEIYNFDSLTFGKEEPLDELLKEYLEIKNIQINRKFEEVIGNIKEYEEKYDMLIMGNLRYNFLVERLTGKFGVKILENSSIPIFIA